MHSHVARGNEARGWLLAVAFVMLIANIAPAQAPVRTIPFEGTEVFRHILQNRKDKVRIEALQSLDELHANADDAMLIIFGNPYRAEVTRALQGIARFQENGGAVLIAVDWPLRGRQLDVEITGFPIWSERNYGNVRSCPWLTYPDWKDDAAAGDRTHPIFHLLLNGIATNRPSHVLIRGNRNAIVPLLDFQAEPFGLHYIAGSPKDAPPSGRSLYIAGHGIFMNGMLMQKQTDNFAFAINVVDWLQEGPNGKQRSKALFLVDGTILPDFDAKLTPPIPMPSRTIINRFLRNLEEESFFHRVVYGQIDDLDRVAAICMLLATLGLVMYGGKKLLGSRQQVELAVPRMVGAAAVPPPALPHTALRHVNFRREARQLARAWLRQEFGIDPSASMYLRVERYFWTPGATQRQANLLLQMACLEQDAFVAHHEFVRFAQALRQVTQALREERVTLLLNGKTVRKSA
jgi:hypothetical protein